MKIEVKNLKYLFFYRSLIGKLFKYYTKNPKYKKIVNALNIKSRKKRITYVYKEASKEIDKYYKEDLCKFKNNKCILQRHIKKDYYNGCCRICLYRTGGACKVNNIACKLFYCDYIKVKLLKVNEIDLLKVLKLSQRSMLRSDYFSTEKQVINDLYYGFIIGTFRVLFRFIKIGIVNRKEKDYE